MAGLVQTVTLDLSQFQDWAQQTGRALETLDFTPVFKVDRLLIIADVRDQFAGSHGPDGAPWAPLKYRQGQPLRDKGFLMGAWTAPEETVTRDTLILMNNLEYAGPQHGGALFTRPERTRPHPETPWRFTGPSGVPVFTRRIKAHTVEIPARPVGVSNQAAERIAQAHAEFVMGTL